jgi:signal transduction histidine kinase/CheY-like chemotaxis protein
LFVSSVDDFAALSIAQRRLLALAQPGAFDGNTPEQACQAAAAVLAGLREDVPFALLYLLDDIGAEARLAGAAGLEPGEALAPKSVLLRRKETIWPFGDAWTAELEVQLPAGGRALTLPLRRISTNEPYGFLVGALTQPDNRDFLRLAAGHAARAIRAARGLQREQQRADALAELDRAKTAFFSNVSHELRTPLTLMLGPIEDGLADEAQPLSPRQRERQQLARRNGLRLQRLVNSLLDLARFEAAHSEVNRIPTDLAALTRDLASSFDAALSGAGLQLIVDCPQLAEPVPVDPSMWEKIVLNLLSNAFKFTFQGTIRIALEGKQDQVELTVQDTGVGIAEADLPRIFERFHRVESAQGRDEGTGIGLSLVRELVQLHGGTVSAQSTLGQGSTFTVSLPARAVRFPKAEEQPQRCSGIPRPAQSEVLLVEDHPEMRGYVAEVLEEHFTVRVVAGGEEALAHARATPPDAILSDVMMPGMDGFALVRALRADPRTAQVPVILLSAHAGEEARVFGLRAGADDYVVKPFGARELVARLDAAIKAAQARAERERLLTQVQAARADAEAARQRLANLIENAPVFVAALKGPQHVFELCNPLFQRLVGADRDFMGRPVAEALPEMVDQGFIGLLDRVYRTGQPFTGSELPLGLDREGNGELHDAFVSFVYQPRRDLSGNVSGVDVFGFEVTGHVLARHKAEALAAELGRRAEFEQQLIGMVSHDLRNPLGAVLLGSSALSRRSQLDDRSLFAVTRIHSAAERADRMMDDLLDFTRARFGGIHVEREPVDLDQLTQKLLAELRAAHPGRDLTVEAEGDTSGNWDPLRIAQLERNLLVNALDYSPAGTGVRVHLHGGAHEVALAVHNDGPPIPARRWESIFQPVQRAAAAAGRSVGLGLYIAQSIVHAHGGTISVMSQAGAGTTFEVRLPRSVSKRS